MNVKVLLNNNALLLVDNENNESVVCGKGLGFKYKKGDVFDDKDAEKRFVLKDKSESNQLITLLNSVPHEYFDISRKIIDYARETLNLETSSHLLIALTDHLHFAVKRHKEKISFQNQLLYFIKNLHPKEFKVGEYGVYLLHSELNVDLPEEEAGNIAMHIITTTMDAETLENDIKKSNALKDICNIVKFSFNVDIKEDDLNYMRFMTHLSFFMDRVLTNQLLSGDDELFYQVASKYKEANNCAQRVASYILKTFSTEISNEEMVYLIVHINRVVNRNAH